jgi:hypothetical protein
MTRAIHRGMSSGILPDGSDRRSAISSSEN